MNRLNILLIVIMLAAFTEISVTAQSSDVVLQISVPFFAEDILQPVIEQYEGENPGIHVLLVPYGGFGLPVADSDDPEEYLDNLAEYFGSADILFVDSDMTPEATRAGYVLNLSPLTQSDPAFDAADYHRAILQSFMWDAGQWALPISTDFTVVSYNPAAFDAAGLAYPTEAWTLADLDFAARNLVLYTPDGSVAMPGLLVAGGGSLSTLFVSLIGQSVYTEASFPNNPDFNIPQLETTLDTWLQMEADGLFELPEDFDNDEVPLIIGNPQGFGPGFGGGFGNQDQPTRATALLPGGRAGLSAVGYAVSSGTLYPEAAYDLINYLIRDPNAVAASLGTVPALRNVETDNGIQGGPGGGPGGFLANAASVPEELEPLVDIALERGISVAENRFSDGITTALSLMQDEGLSARSALDQVQNEILTGLVAADARAGTTRISVVAPDLPTELAAGEIQLDFAILGGGPGFALENQWQAIADSFAEIDPAVGRIDIEPENQNQLAEVVENYDCFYASSNLVPDADLDQLLSLDPLVNSDPAFDPNDFIGGVFDQIKLNNQTWAVPLQISPLVLRYNVDVYNRAGVTPPQGSWTVAEFEDAIRQLKFVLTEDQFPVELNASGQTALLALIGVYGGLPFDVNTDPLTVNFTDPATIAAIQQVLDLAKGGYISYANGGGFGGGGGGANAQSDDPIPTYSNVVNAFGFGGFGGGFGGGGGANNTDGIVTFPLGTRYNAVPFELGTAYISASTQNPEDCYRFIGFLSDSTELFQSMPARHSVINSQSLLTTQGADTVAFYRSLADIMEQPNTLLFPNNINAGNFGMSGWLLDVFDRYLADEVVDLETDLGIAEQTTRDYLTCVAAIPAPDPAQGNFQGFFQQVQECQAAVAPDA